MLGILESLYKIRDPSAAVLSAPRVPEDRRLYAIGDIHGRYDLLLALQERMLSDAAEHPDKHKAAIYLGDYVDRGPQSREVLEHLSTGTLPGVASIHLMGNHEHALLGFLRDPLAHSDWLQYGGPATLASYGIDASQSFLPSRLIQMARELQLALPPHQLQFLEQLETYRIFGDYLFVHAGIRPGVPLARQQPDDLLWIREAFLHYRKPHPHFIVHGHHISDRPEIRPNRIGIDTGAFATGRLSCLVLEGVERTFIDTLPTR